MERLSERAFDLVITDLKMGAVSGWDLFFHETMARPEMVIFVITALPPTMTGGVEHSAAEFFQKPVDIESLIAAIRRHFG